MDRKCSNEIDSASYILGNFVYYCALAGPLFLNRPLLSIAPKYYAVTLATSFVLTLMRGILARVWPNVKAFQRPIEHGDDGSLREYLYVGGFPSGHAFQVAFFCTMMCIAFPNVLTLVLAAVGIIMVALFRFCKQFHTPLQIATGAAIGVGMAAGTAPWVLDCVKS